MTQSTTPASATPGRWGSFSLPAQRGADPSAAIDAACRNLGLTTIRDRWEEFAAQALREHASYADFLADLLESEFQDRDERRKLRRVKEANFPRNKRIEDFDFSKNPNVPQEVINTLTQPGWVHAGHPLCLIGDSGTGKSHLLIGLGTAIAEAGGRVRYTTAANLVNELAEAAGDKQLGRTIKKYGRVDLLCLDELGYVKPTSLRREPSPTASPAPPPSGRQPPPDLSADRTVDGRAPIKVPARSHACQGTRPGGLRETHATGPQWTSSAPRSLHPTTARKRHPIEEWGHFNPFLRDTT
ncbi:ATP-binding protein [Streptomyces sp. NPDC004623]|uniref:ATP-binding protein n=1 Tax=Streptomyces sp. NPDC004623 TaxID=3156653 RepID=UPI0033AEAB9F